MTAKRDVLITGIGLVTSLGEGVAANLEALNASAPAIVDDASFAPYPIHPTPVLDLDKQIPKKGDQRQMEPWQRLGTYSAGLALSDAGLAGQPDLLSRTHMVVAAGGGERDIAVDEAIMRDGKANPERERILNERLSNDIRPTLFLAQLSNLLAGNISLVHGVTGSSRTFMGEEAAGVDAMRTLSARIAAGQADIGLVGGAYSAARADMLLLFRFGSLLQSGPHMPVWARGADGGMITGSVGAFLVLEAREHAEARGARAYARLGQVVSDRSNRAPGAVKQRLGELLQTIAPALPKGPLAVMSGATGIGGPTAEERAALEAFADEGLSVRATGSRIGHAIEPTAIANVALSAAALHHGTFFPPFDPSEAPVKAAPEAILVTSVGHWRGEGLAVVARA